MDYTSAKIMDLWIIIIYILGEYPSSSTTVPEENFEFIAEFANGGGFNNAVVNKNSTRNFEMLNDDGHAVTPTSVIIEPYFDTQTLKNVTGLVGKVK